jgi:hypothetical protein
MFRPSACGKPRAGSSGLCVDSAIPMAHDARPSRWPAGDCARANLRRLPSSARLADARGRLRCMLGITPAADTTILRSLRRTAAILANDWRRRSLLPVSHGPLVDQPGPDGRRVRRHPTEDSARAEVRWPQVDRTGSVWNDARSGGLRPVRCGLRRTGSSPLATTMGAGLQPGNGLGRGARVAARSCAQAAPPHGIADRSSRRSEARERAASVRHRAPRPDCWQVRRVGR